LREETVTALRYLMIVLVLFVFVLSGAVQAAELPVVRAIEIRGLKRIEESALKNRITQKTGEVISQDRTSEDIKTIFKMGYFEDVRAEIDPFEGGIKLIFVIREKPTIVRIEFQGNKEYEDSKLQEKISLSAGAIADAVLIQDTVAKLRTFYEEEGYWLSRIVPVIKRINPDEVSLTFQIEEGKQVKIRDIHFEGSRVFAEDQLKKVIETRERWLFSFLTGSGYYKKDRMDVDIEKLRDFYFNNGFIKAVIGDPVVRLTDDREGMTIRIPVSEGEQFRISSLEFSGNTVFDSDTLRKRLTLQPDTPFSKETLRKDVFSISELYSENGYAIVTITPDLIPDEGKKLVKVLLRIAEGEKYRIGRIEIAGNIKTRDKVIRREVRLDEGDEFNSALLRRSYERINNLNFFDNVELTPKPRPDEKLLDLDIKVKERPTGFLSVGGGYSSVDRFIAMVDLTQGNLFGRGQFIKFRGELGGRSTLYEVSFREPWFLDTPISFTTNVYKTTRQYIAYDKKATGFGVSFGKSFSEYWRGDIGYNIETATIYDVTDDAPKLIKEQRGTNITSSISPSIVRDSRNNFLDPTKGSKNAIYFTYAGLGGTNYFFKSVAESAWYFPVRSSAFLLRGRFGYGTGIWGKELPLYERFYVGGINSVRGLGFGDAGPRDADTGDVIGGTEELLFNAEYIFPLVAEARLKGVIFFDAGNAYDSFKDFGTLRYTTGAGFRWISPIGPIRLEWGYNLDPKPGESRSRFEFTFGTFF